MWICYILRCADNTLYTGVTTNLERRLYLHGIGAACKYTSPCSRRPVKLVYQENGHDHSTALRREREIKKLTRANKERLLRGTLR